MVIFHAIHAQLIGVLHEIDIVSIQPPSSLASPLTVNYYRSRLCGGETHMAYVDSFDRDSGAGVIIISVILITATKL